MKRNVVRVVNAMIVSICLFVAQAVEDVSATTNMRWGFRSPVTVTQTGPDRCTATTAVWLQELGSSGVNRLRVKFELKGYYDPGYLPSYGSTNWAKSNTFPDDSLSYSMGFNLNPYFYISNGKTMSVWAKFIGQRPSFWKPDLKIHKKLGDVTCDITDPTQTGDDFNPAMG